MQIGVTEYKSREEAQHEADKINSCEPTKDCPLTNSKCKDTCVCWNGARVVEYQKGCFRVYGCECENQMFWRECNHEV